MDTPAATGSETLREFVENKLFLHGLPGAGHSITEQRRTEETRPDEKRNRSDQQKKIMICEYIRRISRAEKENGGGKATNLISSFIAILLTAETFSNCKTCVFV